MVLLLSSDLTDNDYSVARAVAIIWLENRERDHSCQRTGANEYVPLDKLFIY